MFVIAFCWTSQADAATIPAFVVDTNYIFCEICP